MEKRPREAAHFGRRPDFARRASITVGGTVADKSPFNRDRIRPPARHEKREKGFTLRNAPARRRKRPLPDAIGRGNEAAPVCSPLVKIASLEQSRAANHQDKDKDDDDDDINGAEGKEFSLAEKASGCLERPRK